MPDPLTFDDHNGPKGERTLVYPVLSRRSGGLSVGINLNPGKECNWACVYCEVEGLVRGAPGPIDVTVLERELDEVLREALMGRWTQGEVHGDARSGIKDICIAGDGEPTLSPNFAAAVEVVSRLRDRHGLEQTTKLVVITNGSRAQHPATAVALKQLSAAGGELWFKIDAGTEENRVAINQTQQSNGRLITALTGVTKVIPTWIQTMAVHPHSDIGAIADLVQKALAAGAVPEGMLLYGLKRPSLQPGGAALRAFSQAELEAAGEVLRAGTKLEVQVFA